MLKSLRLGLAVAFAVGSQAGLAQDQGTRMLRHPDVYQNQVVFSYAGDLWLAEIDKPQAARRLTSHPGLELFPKFSPDGRQIAFTGQYRGDDQVYVISVEGGEPQQLTYYPTPGPLPARWGTEHQVFGWSSDGSQVLFRTGRDAFDARRLYQVPVAGGLSTALPMPRAGSGDFSPDGKQIVYSPLFRDFRTWKRYQGGWAQNLYVWNLENNQVQQITDHQRTERDPVWLSDGIYYVSDRDGTLNLYRYDASNQQSQQLTQHQQWDMKWASGDGQNQIVYEYAGQIALFDSRSGSERVLNIQVPDDGVRRIARHIPVGDQVENASLSPDGQRVLFSARGDVFSVPVEHGITRNLTQQGKAHDREAVWSPDGRWVAFISDRSGDEAIYVVPQDGGEAKQLSNGKRGRIYNPSWSPDSQQLAFVDHQGALVVVDLKGKEREVVRNPYARIDDYSWSPDSAWLAYTQPTESGIPAIFLWSRSSGENTLATDPFFVSYSPSFSPDGQYLYYISDREFAPQIGSFEWNYVVDRESGIYGLALNAGASNPFGPRNDETKVAGDGADAKAADKVDDKADGKAPAVKIDFNGLAQRSFRVPVEANNLQSVIATDKQLIYTVRGAFYYGRQSDVKPSVYTLDFESREPSLLVEGVAGLSVAANGEYLLASVNGAFQRYEVGKKDSAKSVSTDNMSVYRAPSDEWAVIFDEVWRRFRDYFYVPNMHGYDWDAIGQRYRSLLKDVSTREDLNYLMGEMIAELNVGHAYVSGGDLQAGKRSAVALLGARFAWDEGAKAYRVDHIFKGHNEEAKYRSPLTEVGVNVQEGDFIYRIDGQALTRDRNPYALLTDRGQQPVELEVGRSADKTRRVLVDPIDSEAGLVYLEWVQQNYDYVQEKSDGRLGYLHIPDMGADGIYEFIKWYYPQLRKQGFVIDVRGNGGGNVSSMILQRLAKRPLAFGYQAHSSWSETYPQGSFNGPMVALISETSASDGDIFPYFFREAGLGPLIGKLTWGGVVGISGHGPLIDGGDVFVPEFGLGQNGKGWIIEGEGVKPDIEVDNDPTSAADEQLDRGIEEALKRVNQQQPSFLPKPPAPVKTS